MSGDGSTAPGKSNALGKMYYQTDLDYSANKLNVDDMGFLRAMVDKLIAEIGLDPCRVFATGISRDSS